MMAMKRDEGISIDQFCRATDMQVETIIEIVDQGIVEPIGDTPQSWTFSTHMVTVTNRARRLHQDLEIDWPGIALAISLIDELEQLRAENERLQLRLGRFMDDPDIS